MIQYQRPVRPRNPNEQRRDTEHRRNVNNLDTQINDLTTEVNARLIALEATPPSFVYTSVPVASEGRNFDERIVKIDGIFYRFTKIQGTWLRLQYA